MWLIEFLQHKIYLIFTFSFLNYITFFMNLIFLVVYCPRMVNLVILKVLLQIHQLFGNYHQVFLLVMLVMVKVQAERMEFLILIFKFLLRLLTINLSIVHRRFFHIHLTYLKINFFLQNIIIIIF